MIEIDKIPNYLQQINLDINKDLYHPNEIFAHYFSEMLLDLKPRDHNIMELIKKIEFLKN